MDVEKLRHTVKLIRDDCTNDAKAMEGAPFTGRVVAEQFGNTLAMVDALAAIVDEILAEIPQPKGT